MVKSTHICSKEADIAIMGTNITNMKEKIDDIHKSLPALVSRVDKAEGGLKVSQWIFGVALICISIYVNYKV